MGVTLTDVLLFGKAQSDDVDNATLVIYRRNIMRWSAIGGYLDIIVKGVAPLSLPDAIANSLSYVKAFGGTEQRSVPAGYTQLAYIGSAGTQYIDLGYKGNGNTKVDVKFKYHTVSSATGSGRVFGSRISSSSNAFAVGTSSGIVAETANTLFWCYDNQPYFQSDENFGINVWKTVVFSATEHSIDGVSIGNDYEVVEFETPQNLKLFGFDNNGSMGVGYVDVAYCKLWDNGVLVRDLVPARRDSDNTLGMYDRVSGAFLTNDGTGTFTAGPTAVPTPDVPMSIVSNNGVLKYSANMANVNAQTALVGYYISAQGSVLASTSNWMYQDFIPVKPNTTYTLSFSAGLYFVSISEYTADNDSGFIRRNTKISSTSSAPFNVTFITIATSATTNYIRFGSNMYNRENLTLADALAVDWMLNQGNAMPYTPYRSPTGIYADGTVETINVHGKNIFNKDDAQVGKNWNGSNMAYSIASDYIPAKKGDAFTLSVSDMPKYASTTWAVLDSNYTYLGGTSNGSEITQDACAYIRLSIRCASSDTWTQSDLDNAKIQLEKGTTATEYQPYYNGGTATAEMLLKVGDYEDVQSMLDGVVTRNVGVKVLDGTENWSGANNQNYFSLRKTYIKPAPIATTSSQTFCTHLLSSPNFASQEETIWLGLSYLNINYNNAGGGSSSQEMATFKQWLADQYAAGTPVIVIYPLATPTTESVAGQALQVTGGDNVLEITQASLNGLELEAKYKAAVSLTIQEVQDANLDPNVEVTIN